MKRLLVCALIISNAHGMIQLGQTSTLSPSKLGKVNVTHSNKQFKVVQNGKVHDVQNAWVDKPLRGIETAQLAKYLRHGYISVNQLDNGEFTLKANNRVNGGEPVMAATLYWITKVSCWTAVSISAGAVVTSAVASAVGS